MASSVNTDEMSALAGKLNRQLQSGHAIAKSKSPTEARETTKSIDTDVTSTTMELSQQLQSDATEQPTILSATDDRRSSVPTNRLRPKVRTMDAEPEVVHLLVRENLDDNQRPDAYRPTRN